MDSNLPASPRRWCSSSVALHKKWGRTSLYFLRLSVPSLISSPSCCTTKLLFTPWQNRRLQGTLISQKPSRKGGDPRSAENRRLGRCNTGTWHHHQLFTVSIHHHHGTKTFSPGKGCSVHTRALRGMTCLPFCPSFPTLSPLSSLVLHSPDMLPSGSPGTGMLWSLPIKQLLSESSDTPQHNVSPLAEGAGSPQLHTPTLAPQSCAQEAFPGDSGLGQFWFGCWGLFCVCV